MKIPSAYSEIVNEELVIEPVADDALVYPPVGFVDWSVGEVGNGDKYGYYWPIGRENVEPIVAMMSHDCWSLIPIASSLEGLSRIGASGEITGLVAEENEVDFDESDGESELLPIAERLALDPRSPYLSVAAADEATTGNDVDRAESLYTQAIEVLPEYTAAHFGLAMLYRRQRKLNVAIRWMLEAIRSPLCFRGASFWTDMSLPTLNRNDFRKKCLIWLQQARAQDVGSVADDPLFQVRDRLTFATGVKTSDDFDLYDQVIEQYVASGRTLDAVRLLMLVGELMVAETVSFRDRYGFTMPKYRERLLTLLRRADLERTKFLEPATNE